jgi:DNA-binding CsgD family transcriptional regulator
MIPATEDDATDADGLERLAATSYLLGGDDTAELWERAYRECVRRGEPARAARCAFWLAYGLLGEGEVALAGGWLARAGRLLDEATTDGAERGYLLLPEAIGCFENGDAAGALARFRSACEIAERFGDADLAALGRMGCGRAMVALGDCAGAVTPLDEAMVAVRAGELSPIATGLVYCGAIETCQEMFDLRRAKEWTGALSRWCDRQPDLVPFRGECLVHRTEILELHGDWEHALAEARRACEWLAGKPAVGDALYRRAELHRLRGELAEAEAAYRAASRAGRQPQPGLALLRLAQGDTAAAAAAIRRLVDEVSGAVARARVLGAYVEIMLAVGDTAAARAGADELDEVAGALGAPPLRALAAHATGAVRLADGDARGALPPLRAAWAAWRDLDCPYQTARVRVLVGLAYRALGDRDTADMEFDAARLGFTRLGARIDLARLDALLGGGSDPRPGGLTAREVEVLALVARGLTNREIASALVISEHTVARHVQNILGKLDLPSRTAASHFAHRHGLL